MQKSESIIKLTAALIKAKRSFSPLIRNQENPGFKRGNQVSKYADLAAVIEATEAALLENGLVLTQFPHNDGERVGVQNMLVHESGEFLEHTFTVAIIKQDAQTSVAGITYARRVSMKAILGISDEDDDGNTASGTGAVPKTSMPAPKSVAAAPTQVPKAEIPKDLPSASKDGVPAEEPAAVPSNLSVAGSSEMPTEEQLVEFRKQFKQLGDDLATAGLKAGRGLPINRKVRAFLLAFTKADDPAKVTLAQWTEFFRKVELTKQGDGGIKRLVTVVNEANGITEEKKQ
jgi:hypothetical protein